MKYYKKFLKSGFIIFFLSFLIITSDVKADQLSDISFSSDGSKILSRHKNRISVWETATGKLLRTFETGTDGFNYAAFLPDEKTVFAVNAKAEMVWLDIETGEPKNKMQGKSVYPYAISANGETVVHSSASKSGNKEIIEFYDTRYGTLTKTFKYPSNTFVCLSFFPDGKKLLAVGDNISVISLKTGETEKSFDFQLPVLTCAVSPRGDSILTSSPVGSAANNLQIYSLRKKQKYSGLKKEDSEQIGSIGAVGYSPAGGDLAFAAGTNRNIGKESAKGLLIIWNIKSGIVKQKLKTASPLASAAFSIDGKTVLAQEISGYLTLFDTETGAVIRKYSELPVDAPDCQLIFKRDGLPFLRINNRQRNFLRCSKFRIQG